MTTQLLLQNLHLAGLALGGGAAAVKVALLLRARRDQAFVPAYFAVAKIVTGLIVLGMAILTVSGGVRMWLYRPHLTSAMTVKLVIVLALWVLGPVMDKVIEPPAERLAPGPGEARSPAFIAAQGRHLRFEWLMISLFVAAAALGTLLKLGK